MLLPPEEATLFLALYPHLISFAAGRLGGVEGIVDFASFRAASREAKGRARDRLLDNIALIDAFVEENPGEFRETDLAHVLACGTSFAANSSLRETWPSTRSFGRRRNRCGRMAFSA